MVFVVVLWMETVTVWQQTEWPGSQLLALVHVSTKRELLFCSILFKCNCITSPPQLTDAVFDDLNVPTSVLVEIIHRDGRLVVWYCLTVPTCPLNRWNNLKKSHRSFKFFDTINTMHLAVKKGKAFPPQAWTGPWSSWRLRLQNF
jgi:hypothetical protein